MSFTPTPLAFSLEQGRWSRSAMVEILRTNDIVFDPKAIKSVLFDELLRLEARMSPARRGILAQRIIKDHRNWLDYLAYGRRLRQGREGAFGFSDNHENGGNGSGGGPSGGAAPGSGTGFSDSRYGSPDPAPEFGELGNNIFLKSEENDSDEDDDDMAPNMSSSQTRSGPSSPAAFNIETEHTPYRHVYQGDSQSQSQSLVPSNTPTPQRTSFNLGMNSAQSSPQRSHTNTDNGTFTGAGYRLGGESGSQRGPHRSRLVDEHSRIQRSRQRSASSGLQSMAGSRNSNLHPENITPETNINNFNGVRRRRYGSGDARTMEQLRSIGGEPEEEKVDVDAQLAVQLQSEENSRSKDTIAAENALNDLLFEEWWDEECRKHAALSGSYEKGRKSAKIKKENDDECA